MKLFSYDGKLMNFLTTFWNIIWIGFLWIVCSLPLFTIGAASTAAYYTMSKSVRNNTGYVTKEFFHSFKLNFKQAFFLTVSFLFFGIIVAADCYYFYYDSSTYAASGRIFSLILVLTWLTSITYACAWLSRFHITTGHLIKYSFGLTISYFPRTMALIVFWIAFFIFAYWIPWIILFLPGFKCYADTIILDPLQATFMERLRIPDTDHEII